MIYEIAGLIVGLLPILFGLNYGYSRFSMDLEHTQIDKSNKWIAGIVGSLIAVGFVFLTKPLWHEIGHLFFYPPDDPDSHTSIRSAIFVQLMCEAMLIAFVSFGGTNFVLFFVNKVLKNQNLGDGKAY